MTVDVAPHLIQQPFPDRHDVDGIVYHDFVIPGHRGITAILDSELMFATMKFMKDRQIFVSSR